MSLRRRPIPRSRTYPSVSQHFEMILGGAVRRYHSDGREVCTETAQGRREYAKRLQVMVQRQLFRCPRCKKRLSLAMSTFDHWPKKRRMGAAFRDDRVVLEDGSEINRAVHWRCQ
jgi:hypothetical protein